MGDGLADAGRCRSSGLASSWFRSGTRPSGRRSASGAPNDEDNNSWSFSYPMYEDFRKTPGVDVAGFQDLNGAVTQIKGRQGPPTAAW